MHAGEIARILKAAALKKDVELQPQQERVVERLRREPAVLAYHQLGAGKTLAAIAAGEETEGPKEVVVPAALRENFRKELNKFISRPKGYAIKSYQAASSGGMDPAALTIFDEAHRMGSEGTISSHLPEQASGKLLFLTGTPIRNEPAELVPLLKALGKGRKPPATAKAFEEQFVAKKSPWPGLWAYLKGVRPGPVESLANKDKLVRLLKGRVDYWPARGEFPSVEHEHVTVDMSPDQSRVYEGVMRTNPILAYKIVHNLPPTKAEATQLNAFLAAARQVSNNPKAFSTKLDRPAIEYSPKLQRMAADLQEGFQKDPHFKALVYSNYLEGGILPFAEHLAKLKIPYALFHGQMDDADRKKVVNQYNTGKAKVLLVSGAGSEGLDLKGTKMVQLMEPHWNAARLQQVVGRAARHQSHSQLPPDERKVVVRHYFSKPAPTLGSRALKWVGIGSKPMGADEYLQNLSEQKQRLIDQFLSVLKQVGSEPVKAAMDPEVIARYPRYAAQVKSMGQAARAELAAGNRAALAAALRSVRAMFRPNLMLGQYVSGHSLSTGGRISKALETPATKLAAGSRLVKMGVNRARLLLVLAKRSDFAPGLPDPTRFGDPTKLPIGVPMPFVVQRHEARRAGTHYDVRFGPDNLFSWATKHELPEPGKKRMLYAQPLHRGSYARWEGDIVGYGAGHVSTKDYGSILVTKAEPNQINIVLLHHKYPEYFSLIRQSGPPANPRTPREAKMQGGNWLMVNTTPMVAAKFMGAKTPQEAGLDKPKYTSVPAAEVDKLFNPNYLVQAKIDGGSALFHLLEDKIEAISYRTAKDERPIIHTYRVFGPGGATYKKKLPRELIGSILRGEVYGTKKNQAIPPQELGGLLNASIQKSLATQKEHGVHMRVALFDLVRAGELPVGQLGASERQKRLEALMPYLPGQFELPETAASPEAAKALWQRISTGGHQLTGEGIVAWPQAPGKPPIKAKLRPEADVWIRRILPMESETRKDEAGGFEYSLGPEPDSPVVGRIGSGFDTDARQDMLKNPDLWLGRMARIQSQGQFPESGAHRAPVFIARHEDYPATKAGQSLPGSFMNPREMDANKPAPPKPDRSAANALGWGALGATALSFLGQRGLRWLARHAAKAEQPVAPTHIGQLIGAERADPIPRYYMDDDTAKALGLHGNAAFVPGWLKESLRPVGHEAPAAQRALQTAHRLTDPKRGLILVPKRVAPSLLAHEMGHATGDSPGKWRSLLGLGLHVLAPIGAGVAGLAVSTTNRSAISSALRSALIGGGVGLAANIPTLYEEARATRRARRGMERTGLTEEARGKAKSTLRRAYLTYIFSALAPSVAGSLLGTSLRAALQP